MKNFTFLLLSFLALFLMSSCNDDHVKKSQNFTITVDATAFKAYATTSYLKTNNYIILSDEAGNPVSTTEIEAGKKYEISPKDLYTDKTVMLTELVIREFSSGAQNILLSTYIELAAEDMAWKFEDQYLSNDKYATFPPTNMPAKNSGTLSTNTTAVTLFTGLNSNGFSYPLSFSGSATNLFATQIDATTGVASYRFFDNGGVGYPTGGTFPIDFNQVNQVMPTKAISFPNNVLGPTVYVQGIIKSGALAGTYTILMSNQPVIPDLPAIFDDYSYLVHYTKNNYAQTITTFTTPDMEPLNMAITAMEKTNTTLRYTTTGDYDFEQVRFVGTNGDWKIYAPHSSQERTITLPTIPTELNAKWNQLNPVFYRLVSFEATDLKDEEGYVNFLKTRETRWFKTVPLKSSFTFMQ